MGNSLNYNCTKNFIFKGLFGKTLIVLFRIVEKIQQSKLLSNPDKKNIFKNQNTCFKFFSSKIGFLFQHIQFLSMSYLFCREVQLPNFLPLQRRIFASSEKNLIEWLKTVSAISKLYYLSFSINGGDSLNCCRAF